MNEHYDLIQTASLTEKSSLLGEKLNKYVFRVAPRANKLQIKAITTGRAEPRATMAGRGEGRFQFSQSLANRCFSRGESILCHRATRSSIRRVPKTCWSSVTPTPCKFDRPDCRRASRSRSTTSHCA